MAVIFEYLGCTTRVFLYKITAQPLLMDGGNNCRTFLRMKLPDQCSMYIMEKRARGKCWKNK